MFLLMAGLGLSLCVLLSNDFLLFLISSNSSIASPLFTLAVSSIIFAAVMLLVLMGLLASALSILMWHLSEVHLLHLTSALPFLPAHSNYLL